MNFAPQWIAAGAGWVGCEPPLARRHDALSFGEQGGFAHSQEIAAARQGDVRVHAARLTGGSDVGPAPLADTYADFF